MGCTTVLLIEDDEDDVLFFQRAVTKSKFPCRVQVVRTGEEAIAYMRGDGEFADRQKFPFPKFIMTDMHLPRISGKEFLKWLKSHPEFRVVPIIILGGSGSPADVEYAYDELGIHAYIVKPASPAQLENVVKLIFDYWSICEVPLWKLQEVAERKERMEASSHRNAAHRYD